MRGRFHRLFVLGALYLAQGLPFGFFTQALPVRMREMGVGLGAIGLSSLLALPWALKFLGAPLVDRIGTRLQWILPLQLASCALLFALSFTSPEQSWPLVLTGVLVSNLLAAAQDVATDGWAVDLLPPEDRGLGNGVQVAGYRAGMIVGGGALLSVLGDFGWDWAVRGLAVGLALSTLPALLAPPPTVPRAPRAASARAGRSELRASLSRLSSGGWIVVLLLYKLGDAAAGSMLRPMLVDHGHDASSVGRLLGEFGFGGGLLGAVLGGWLTGLVGRRRALLGFGALQALGLGSYALVAWGWPVRDLAIVFEHVASGMATAALFTCMMDACRERHAATDYTVQACVVVVASGLGASLSGFVAAPLGYAATFGLAALLSLVAVLFVALRARLHSELTPELEPRTAQP